MLLLSPPVSAPLMPLLRSPCLSSSSTLMGSEPSNVHFLFNIMLFVFHRDVDEEAYVMQKVIKL